MKPLNTLQKLYAVVLTLAAVGLNLYVARAVTRFTELFQGFGADLPALTAVMLEAQPLFLLLALVAAILLVVLIRSLGKDAIKQRRAFRWAIWSHVVSFAAASLFIFGMYLPIFRMGSVV